MLSWTTTETQNTAIHSSFELDSNENTLRKAIEACADKAIGMLKTNIQDDALSIIRME